MIRQLIVVTLMLAIGLQGSLTAYAATSPLMPAGCQTTAISHSDMYQDSCCAGGQHAMSCCLDLCLPNVGATMSPAALIWYSHATPDLPVLASSFSSRGDSPLIRPPIL
jgi:hypothetical protein